jgi:adenylate cyclase class 2
MEEIEAKILEVNRAKIEEILIKLGAKKIFDDEILTLSLDFKDNTIIKQRDVLRLRKEAQTIELTYKKVRISQKAKIAEEYSVEVSSLDVMMKILGNLGLHVINKMQKHRVSYRLDDARFDFDLYMGEYGYIPEFLEIEAKDIESITKYAASLGFKEEDCLPWSTQELIQHYSPQHQKSKSSR